MTIHVFLSHLDADAPHAVRLCRAIEELGLTAWSPALDLMPGDLSDEVAPRALGEAAIVAFLVSDRWPLVGQRQDWERAEEIIRAIDDADRTGKRIVPVLLDGVSADHIPHGLRRPTAIHTTSADFIEAAAALRRVLDHPVAVSESTAALAAGWGPAPGPIHTIRLTTPVGDQTRVITDAEIHHACNPARPLEAGLVIDLALTPGESRVPFEAWAGEIGRRVRGFLEHRVAPSKVNRLGLFAFAPIPLLMTLGRVIGDQHPAVIFGRQRHTQSWRWDAESGEPIGLALDRPPDGPTAPDIALLVSISARVKRWAVEAALPQGFDLFELRATTPGVEVVRTRADLAAFARLWRELLDAAHEHSRGVARVHVFAAVPISIAIQMGLGLIPKADPALVVHDFRDGVFHPVLRLAAT